jgi:hypothetical protein
MDFGVYFPTRSDYPALRALGIVYAVRPVLMPATDRTTDAGFVSAPVIERTDDPAYTEAYGGDEVLDPTPDGRARLAALLPGQFAGISNGGYGFNAWRLGPQFHRALENGGGDPIAPLRMLIAALNCRRLWGTDWTVVMYAGAVWWMRAQLWFYRRLGVKRVFIWRWDYQQAQIRKALRV